MSKIMWKIWSQILYKYIFIELLLYTICYVLDFACPWEFVVTKFDCISTLELVGSLKRLFHRPVQRVFLWPEAYTVYTSTLMRINYSILIICGQKYDFHAAKIKSLMRPYLYYEGPILIVCCHFILFICGGMSRNQIIYL